MKPQSALRPLAFSALLSLASVGVVFAQSPDPSATVAPSKPAAETSTPAPGAAVNSSPAATETKAAPIRAQRSTEEKAARKKERLSKYDTNKDGKLDKSERAAMRAAKGMSADGDKAKAFPTP